MSDYSQEKESWKKDDIRVLLSRFKVSGTVFTPELFEGMNHTRIIKLQWGDTSIIKRTGGNIFCVFAISIRHALLTTPLPFIPLMEKRPSRICDFGAKRILIKKQFTYYNFK